MVGVSNAPIKAFKSLSSEFYLGELKGRHSFFLVESALIHLIGRDLLKTYEAQISFTPKGERFFDLKDFFHHKMFAAHGKGDGEQEKLLGLVFKNLWGLNPTDIGRIHSASPINLPYTPINPAQY